MHYQFYGSYNRLIGLKYREGILTFDYRVFYKFSSASGRFLHGQSTRQSLTHNG